MLQEGPGLVLLKKACDLSRTSIRAALDGKGDQRAATAEIFAMFPSRVDHNGIIIPLSVWLDRHVKPTAEFLRSLPAHRLHGVLQAVPLRVRDGADRAGEGAERLCPGLPRAGRVNLRGCVGAAAGGGRPHG